MLNTIADTICILMLIRPSLEVAADIEDEQEQEQDFLS